MNWKWLFSLAFMIFMLAGCGTETIQNGSSSDDEFENVQEGITDNEQFSFRLVSEKAVYQVGEPLQIKAELTYIGDEASITISHAASPIWLLTTNLTEDYRFDAAMNEPLIRTVLTKDIPFVQDYHFSGGSYDGGASGKPYSDEVFHQMAEGKFPPGQYEIKGRTDFAVGEDILNNKVSLETSIIFTVIE